MRGGGTDLAVSPSVSRAEQFYPVAHVAGRQLLHLIARFLEAGGAWLSSREMEI